VLGLGIFSVLLMLFFGFESDTDFSLNDLEENEYSATSTTIPITVTTSTISPTMQELSSETQRVSATTSKHDYSGAGFAFPLLQKSYGIGASVTTLNYDDWTLGTGANSHFCVNPHVDESGGTYDGNVYMISCAETKIYRFDSTTEVLTTWNTPLSQGGTDIIVNGTGFVFFAAGNDIARLNPATDEITVWSDLSTDYHWTLAIDPTTNDIYFGSAHPTSQIYSLNPETNVLKTWNVESICTHVGFAFHSMVWDDIGKKAYASQLEVPQLCGLDPSDNSVTLYDTGLDLGRSWFIAVDPTNEGHVYLPGQGGGALSKNILRIDTVTPQATVWALTGGYDNTSIAVDSAGIVWQPTSLNSAGAPNWSLLRLVPSTNVITEWDFGHGLAKHSGVYVMNNGTIWESSDTNDVTDPHLFRLNE